ncbi:MAG: hypothetical protein SNJ65_13450, partial [Roseiflexus sp.]
LPELAVGNVARNLGMALDLGGWASLIPLALALLAGTTLLVRATSGVEAPERIDTAAFVPVEQ